MNDEELDRRLALRSRTTQADPAVLDGLARSARSEARPSLRRRITAVTLSALVVVGGGLVAAPAAADVVRHFLAQLGIPIGGGSEVIPESEWIDLSATDLRQYFAYIFPSELPLAPGQSRDDLIDRTYELHAASNTVTQEVSLRRTVESLVYCGWAAELIAAQRSDDDERYDDAAAVVLDAAEWPALVATDGGGITERLREVGAAAVAGERGAGWDAFAAGDCDILGFPTDIK